MFNKVSTKLPPEIEKWIMETIEKTRPTRLRHPILEYSLDNTHTQKDKKC